MKRIMILAALLLMLTTIALAEPEDKAASFAAEHLPGYTFLEGKVFDCSTAFLMDDPAGHRVFVGGAYRDDVWTWTISTPLPADTWCDSYHAGEGCMSIGYAHPGGLPDEWGELPYVECVISLQEDGRWTVDSILDYFYEWFHFDDAGLCINVTGMVYGESSLERDITKIDWVDYPIDLEAVLSTMSDDWGVISEPTLPLYADTDRNTLLAEYLCATPVHVLAYADAPDEKDWESHLAKVQIADSDVVGWLPAYGLLLGQEQLWEQFEEDENGGYFYYITAEEEEAWIVDLGTGTEIYSTPDGKVIEITDYPVCMMYMADAGNGWIHVKVMDSLESGYVRYEDCLSVQ